MNFDRKVAEMHPTTVGLSIDLHRLQSLPLGVAIGTMQKATIGYVIRQQGVDFEMISPSGISCRFDLRILLEEVCEVLFNIEHPVVAQSEERGLLS